MGPFLATAEQLWGTVAIPTAAITQGTALVGDWNSPVPAAAPRRALQLARAGVHAGPAAAATSCAQAARCQRHSVLAVTRRAPREERGR
jgi:hypothetical protein